MTVARFAPSPTGHLHVGNLRTALMNHLVARRAGGEFILRIDDTDPERSSEEFVDSIRRDLEWLGLHWDRIERQSARLDLYAGAAERLRGDGRLYEAFETPSELDLKRKKLLNMGRPPVYDRAALELPEQERDRLRAERGDGVWRFLLDRERIAWRDGVLGDSSVDAASVSDPVLIRQDGQFLYTLASVVDDAAMGVTDVVRGADHVTNTAVQTQIFAALGAAAPRFAHHSLLVGPDGGPLAKRDGSLALRDLREGGAEPMALLSLLARLGSSDPVELRGGMDELADGFDLSRFGAAPTRFDPEDLRRLTARHVRGLDFAAARGRIADAGVPDDLAEGFWEAIRENVSALGEIEAWWALCRDGAEPEVDPDDAGFVAEALAMLPPQPHDGETWGAWTAAVKAATGRSGRSLFMPLRKALTGMAGGPDMARLLPLLQVIRAKAGQGGGSP